MSFVSNDTRLNSGAVAENPFEQNRQAMHIELSFSISCAAPRLKIEERGEEEGLGDTRAGSPKGGALRRAKRRRRRHLISSAYRAEFSLRSKFSYAEHNLARPTGEFSSSPFSIQKGRVSSLFLIQL